MATEDKVPVPSEEKIGMPEHKGTRKRMYPLATFFKEWATPLTILIAVVGLLWGVYQFNAQQAADQTKTLEQNQANLQQQKFQFANLQDQQRQTTFDTYIDRMSDLLIIQHLATSKPNYEARVIARARTFRALSNVDPNRKGSIISFLWEAQLINGPQPIISLNTANLAYANMQNSYLYDVNLSGALVSSAHMQNCDLDGAILMNAHLDYVDFSNTTLRNANLKGADLKGAVFDANTDLSGARYNTKPIKEKDAQGNPLTLEPTQWPQGFDPKAARAICVDC